MKWSPQRGSGSGTCSSSLSPDHAAFPAQCGLSRCRVRVSADLLRGGSGGPRPTTASTAAEPTFWNQMNSFRYCFVNQPILVCETLLRKPDTRPVYEKSGLRISQTGTTVYIYIYIYMYLYICLYIYVYIYTVVPVCEIRKPDYFVNRTCVRFPKQSFANQYWLVYEAITKWIYLVSEIILVSIKKIS